MPFGANRRVPGEALETFCAEPVPQDSPKCDFGDILGGTGDYIWHPFAINFGLWTRSRGLGGHVGDIFGLFGRLSVSMSFLDLEEYQNLLFFGGADVAEVW